MTNRRLSADGRAWVSSEEAARLLDIKRATLYTYVSRGFIRTITDGRRQRYLLEDIRALKLRADAVSGHAAAAASAMDFGAPVLQTAISDIGPAGPRYRGYDVSTLLERSIPFESVAILLLTGLLPARPPEVLPSVLPDEALLSDLGAPGRVELLLPAVVALMRVSGWPSSPLAVMRTLACAIAWCSGEPCSRSERARAATQASDTANTLARALGAPGAREPIERALIVCADHELNASTFAARVAGGTGADDGAILLSALGAWSGPRHGRASEPVEALLDDLVERPSRLRELPGMLSRGEAVAGFGHRLYPGGDPRAVVLLAEASRCAPNSDRWRALLSLLAVARAHGQEPNLDLGLVALGEALGLPCGSARSLFAVGRLAGWLAHGAEQRDSGMMLRPRAERG